MQAGIINISYLSVSSLLC